MDYNGIRYTCVKSGKNLVWNAGVVIPTTTTTTQPQLPAGNFDTTPGGALVWEEDFTGAAGTGIDPHYWTAVTGAGTYGTGEIENNTKLPANLSLDGNGNLNITAKCVATTSPGCTAVSQPMGQTWTSARIWTNGLVNFQYGQLEARIWMPTGSFNWPAFWMMGQSYTSLNSKVQSVNWPYCGELDIAEGLAGNTQDQATIHSNINGTSIDWGQGSGLTQVAPLTAASMTGGWHTYGILWKPNYIAYILDGKVWAQDAYNPANQQVVQTISSPQGNATVTYGPGTPISSIGGNWPFNAPFFIILNDAVGGVSSPKAASNSASGTMKINWVKYYQYQGYGAMTVPTHS
jgi:beta-glucanase (GH16 family)